MTDLKAGQRVWFRPVTRSMMDIDHLFDFENTKDDLVNKDALERIISEYKAVRKRSDFLYLASFVGAAIVVRGGLGGAGEIEGMGFKIPSSLISQQIASVVTSALYSYFVASLVVLSMLSVSIQKIATRRTALGWEFIAGSYEGNFLINALLRPKTVGFSTGIFEMISMIVVLLGLVSVVVLHSALVISGSFLAVSDALKQGSIFPKILGVISLVSSLSAAGAYLVTCVIPMPYTWKPLKSEPSATPSDDAARASPAPPSS